MTKKSTDDVQDPKLKMLIEEAHYLEWINRALKYQISLNDNRLAEIDKVLVKDMEHDKK